jgi:large subunit ribosomal protein L15
VNLTDIKKSKRHHPLRLRVGRGIGSGRGKTSGRGHKGMKSRSGYSRRLTYEGGQMPLFRRMPKVGFSNDRWATPVTVVNVDDLDRFPAGSEVGPHELRDAGLLKGRLYTLKILGRGALDRALTVRAHQFSAAAAEKITQAGGKAEVLGA